MASRCLGASSGGYLTIGWLAACPLDANTGLPNSTNLPGCCSAISVSVGLKNGTGSAAGCLCEAETAAATIFILSSAGNTGKGKIGSYGLPLTGSNGILTQCVALGYTDIYWPAFNNTYSNDCSNVDEFRSATTSDYNIIPSYNQSEGLIIPTKLQNSARIPYVMNLTAASAVIRWRTTGLSKSSACYITNMTLGQASQTCVNTTDMVTGSKGTSDHAVLLPGLTAATKYYYWAGASSAASTYSLGTYFKTAPSSTTAATNVRFWLHGDYGSVSGGLYTTAAQDGGRQTGVLNGFLAYETATQRTADAWLSLGDTVYNTGSDPLFQYNYFNVYGASAASATATSAYGTSPIGRMPVWPAIGNHDTYSWSYLPSMQPGNNNAPLYNYPWTAPSGSDVFVKNSTGYGIAFGSSLPQNGEALNGGAGVSSGTWRYYSFNYGRVHVVVLDSMTSRSNTSMPWDPTIGTGTYPTPATSISSLGAAFDAQYVAAGSPNQMEWLAADLAAVKAAATTDFIIAVYHHPAYSWGSHNSDKEVEMIEMRTLYNPILEAGGVDICFHGHSHGYERMLPTVGFFGNSSTFVPSMVPSGYVASPGGIAPSVFTKAAGITANGGTSYVVAGSGGQFNSASNAVSGSTSYRFPSSASPAAVSDNTGSLVMDINGTTLTLTFVAGGAGTMATGQIGDVFMICKGTCPITPATSLSPPAKTADTIVYASFGDWGWGVGGNKSLLQDLTASTCMQQSSAAYAASCIGNQGHYSNTGYAQISQKAVANAIGAACSAYGGCDFLMNTGDSFYDLGITGGVADPQWASAYLNVYTHPALASTPILSTLGNHDYSILSPTAAAAQIAYSAVDPTHRWYLPAHNYQKFFTSASGATTLQVVEVDSTPLHDRYLYSGGSGGGFATGVSGVADNLVNNPAGNIVINPGVNAANGFSGNLFNDSNYQCYYSFKPTAASSASGSKNTGLYTLYQGASKASDGVTATGYDWTGASTGWANQPTSAVFGTSSSGCKYASPEMAPFATPAARAAAWTNVSNWFSSGATVAQHQVMFSHFPVLSTQQRLTPYYDNALAMWQSLGSAAPSAYYNGHDHIMALVQNSGFQTAGGLTVPFVTTGAAGISDYNGPTSVPAAGYVAGSAAATQAQLGYPLSAQPTSGSKASAKYNPDVGSTTFWSNYNGFTMTTVNKTTMKIEFYLVNCTLQAFGMPCSQSLIGPLSTVYMPAKTPSIAAVPAGTPVVTASLTLAGITPAQFVGVTQAAFISTVASTLAVPSTAVVITSVTASSRRRLLAAGSTVSFSVVTANAAGLSTTMSTAFGTNSAAFVTALNSQLASVGSTASCSGVTVAAAPAASTYGGAAASAAVRSSSVAAAVAALVALAALAL